MPVVAVAAAGLALASGGAAAIGAVVAGTATLATTLTAVAAVGATLGAVGAVTGVEELQTAGMVLGGVGGLGSLAANAGLFGASATTESLFGSVAADGLGEVMATPVNSYFADQISNTGSLINGGMDMGVSGLMNGYRPGDVVSSALPDIAQNTGGNINDIIDSLAGVVKPVQPVAPTEAVAGAASPGITASDALSATTAVSDTALPSPVAAPSVTGKTVSAPQTPTVMKNGIPDVRIPGNTYKGSDGKTYTSDGVRWSPESEGGVWNFLKSSGGGALGMGVLQAGGAFLEGAFDDLKPAQVEAYRAQAAANNAATALAQKQLSNMNSKIPVASRVQPAPVTGAPRSLINNQPAMGGVGS